MALFNVFQDTELVQRQKQLDATWKSLNAAQQHCDGLPDTQWVEFVNNFEGWKEFYDSGSDWSSDSKHATDEWQRIAGEWSRKFATYSCSGTTGSAGGETFYGADSGLPGVKDPPPDMPGFLDNVVNTVGNQITEAKETAGTIAWVAVGLAVLVVLGILYIASRGVSGYGVKVGG